MPADVNVTEKVARAIREPDYIGCSCCAQVDGLDFSADDPFASGVARLALSALADPDVLAGIAGVLGQHGDSRQSVGGFLLVCRCGATVDDHAAHQAAAVVEWLRGRAL